MLVTSERGESTRLHWILRKKKSSGLGVVGTESDEVSEDFLEEILLQMSLNFGLRVGHKGQQIPNLFIHFWNSVVV